MSLARACLLSRKVPVRRNILNLCSQLRNVSTTRKNSDVASIEQNCEVKKQIWPSYGFDTEDPQADNLHMHLGFFFGVTMSLVGVVFFFAYAPNDRDWVTREAFLELRRREQGGLPLIDRNYIDPSKIQLPSDEELGETDIII